jgi:hypothetical membrane protein
LREIKSKPAVWFGTLLFCVVILLAGYLNPGYSHIHQAISELGASNAAHAWMVRWLGFIPLGVSFIVFAAQSRKTFFNNLPYLLFLLTGIAIIMTGIFPTDPHGRRDTFSGIVHAMVGISLLSILSITPLLLAFPRLYRIPPQCWVFAFSFLMGILILILFVMLPNGISPQLIAFHQKILGGYFEIWYPMHGLHQRLLLLLYFIWLFTFSYFTM